MSKWPIVRLEALATFKNGLNFPGTSWGKGTKIVGVSDFGDRLFPDYETLDEVDPRGVVRDADLLAENDILFVRSNGNRELIGRSLLIRGLRDHVSHSGFTIRLRFREGAAVSPRFYAYLFKSDLIRKTLSGSGGGTNINNLNQGLLGQLEVPVPPLDEQEGIAAFLASYDDLIANNQRRIALLESMAGEIYREWFVRMRFPGYAVSSFDRGLPAGWGSVPLGQLIGETKRPVKKGDLAGHARYVGLEHISRKSVALTMHGTPESVDSDKLAFITGDILFSKIRPYLHKVALAHVDGICSTDTLVLKPKRPDFREFALFTVFSETFIEIANTASKGTKMPRADWHFLKQLRISVPSDALLSRFSKMVKPMLDEIATLIQVNESLVTQRDALLPRLISGNLRVDALDIQFPPSMQPPPVDAAQPATLSK